MAGDLRMEFLSKIQDLSSQAFEIMCSKWRSMYEFTEEIERKHQQKFIEFTKDFYDQVIESVEEKRTQLLNEIENKIKELHKLKKDLQISNGEELCSMEIREPYSLFLQEIKESMKEFEKLREDRLCQLDSLRSQEKELCDLLEVSALPRFPNPIPYEHQLDELESHIFKLREDKINRMEFFRESKHTIISLMRELEHEPLSDFEIEIMSCQDDDFIPSTTNISKLKDLRTKIENEYEHIIGYRTGLIDKLTKLWDRIKFEQSERESFLSRWNGVGKSHIKAINDEVRRCEEIQRANIKPIVEQIREEIRELWDLLTYTPDQRLEFRAFTTDHFSEDVLDLHELEVARLQQFYEKYRHLYELIDKRTMLWERMLHLEEIAMDKNRLFNNRGGQLLKEEKERKTLEISVPKVNNQLKSALLEFRKEEGRPFLYHGADLLEQITREWDERIENKEAKKNARKVDNQKLLENEAKHGTRQVCKRKIGTPISHVSEPKASRRDELGSHTFIQKGSTRTPGKLPNIRTPLNISTASIASYSHFQSELNDVDEGVSKEEARVIGDMIPQEQDKTPNSRRIPISTLRRNQSSGRRPATVYRFRSAQDGLEKSVNTPRSAFKDVGNRVPGIGHSSPTLTTPLGRKGTPASTAKATSVPRLVQHRTRLRLDF